LGLQKGGIRRERIREGGWADIEEWGCGSNSRGERISRLVLHSWDERSIKIHSGGRGCGGNFQVDHSKNYAKSSRRAPVTLGPVKLKVLDGGGFRGAFLTQRAIRPFISIRGIVGLKHKHVNGG